MSDRPLQNRVIPDGTIIATHHRGTMYGNRGGRIHDPALRQLHPTKRWATRQWICCVLQFKDRRRPLMGAGYTEMFFLDEVTALAAGHRPCFECRRKDAVRFAQAWCNDGTRETAPEMDRVLHRERLDGKSKKVSLRSWTDLPHGAMFEQDDQFYAKSPRGVLLWSLEGYRDQPPGITISDTVDCLTPPSILNALNNGYEPQWHPSARLDSLQHASI